MKKFTFTLLTTAALSLGAFAQSLPCGNSGAAVCSTGAALSHNGFEYYNDIECFESGVQGEVVVRFKNFSSLTIPGTGAVSVYYLKIDSIKNIPCGVCWSTNKSGNVFATNEQGCIKFTGLTTDQVGQYKLVLDVRAQITPGSYNEQALVVPPGGLSAYENDIPNTRLYLRVKANGSSTCPDADSTAASLTATSACVGVGINDVPTAFSSISISPSPFNATANVNFVATESGDATIAITDLTGKTVWTNNVSVENGNNTINIERGSLTAGIYFLSITKGKSAVTKRFSITD